MVRNPIRNPIHANGGSDLTKEWINISDMMRDSIRNPICANGGSDLTKKWINISSMIRFMN